MATFISKYPRYTVYLGRKALKFADGRYVTEDADEIEVLTKDYNVERVDKPEVKAEAEPAEPVKAAPKRKPSGK